jgi:hypothetical protein
VLALQTLVAEIDCVQHDIRKDLATVARVTNFPLAEDARVEEALAALDTLRNIPAPRFESAVEPKRVAGRGGATEQPGSELPASSGI